MIDLYAWTTPNSRKVTIMLEECELLYRFHPVRIREGEQHRPEFLAINPNNKIPAVIDRDTGITTFESGAILIYLAEKTGQFLPSVGQSRGNTLHWLMWQMSGLGPMLGKVEHFTKLNPGKSAYAEQHFQMEAARLYSVLNGRLEEVEFLNGDAYSIADMAAYPWVAGHDWQQINLDEYPAIKRWFETIAARDQVQRGWQAAETL